MKYIYSFKANEKCIIELDKSDIANLLNGECLDVPNVRLMLTLPIEVKKTYLIKNYPHERNWIEVDFEPKGEEYFVIEKNNDQIISIRKI